MGKRSDGTCVKMVLWKTHFRVRGVVLVVVTALKRKGKGKSWTLMDFAWRESIIEGKAGDWDMFLGRLIAREIR